MCYKYFVLLWTSCDILDMQAEFVLFSWKDVDKHTSGNLLKQNLAGCEYTGGKVLFNQQTHNIGITFIQCWANVDVV